VLCRKMSPFKGIIVVINFFILVRILRRGSTGDFCRGPQKTKVSIAGPGPALRAVMEGHITTRSIIPKHPSR